MLLYCEEGYAERFISVDVWGEQTLNASQVAANVIFDVYGICAVLLRTRSLLD